MKNAKLFWNGRSQAVRLPKEFRFDGNEVSIRREGDCVILEPKPQLSWPEGYWKSWRAVPDDFETPAPLASEPQAVDLDRP